MNPANIWAAFPVWMRRIPIIGWLAIAFVIVFLLYTRARRRTAALESARASDRKMFEARWELEETERQAGNKYTEEVVRAEKIVHEAEKEATNARERVAALEGQALTDEYNRMIERRKERQKAGRK